MKKLQFGFIESEVKIILEALMEKEAVMAKICETSNDEDVIADTGNDLIELRLLIKEISESARLLFGEFIGEFNKDPV